MSARGIELQVKGKTVFSTDNLVDAVSVMTGRGEAAKINLGPEDTVVSLEVVEDDGLNARLEDVDQARRDREQEAVRERQKKVEGSGEFHSPKKSTSKKS